MSDLERMTTEELESEIITREIAILDIDADAREELYRQYSDWFVRELDPATQRAIEQAEAELKPFEDELKRRKEAE